MKPKLLVIELWGLGDLVIATPFLQAASQKYDVTLLAKPYARDLQQKFWPAVQVVPFIAPWTAFRHKYRFFRWPWRKLFGLRHLASQRFDVGLSARWDPRDHLLLWLFRARCRLGYPRLGSDVLLSVPLERPDPVAHRYENWRLLASALGLTLPPRENIPIPQRPATHTILIHTGAGQPVRVWPLDRYRQLALRLRAQGYPVSIACDLDQRKWWVESGETDVVCPRNVGELLQWMDFGHALIGNDSGPCHLAARCGLPTFTIFGPQLPEWFAPLHPQAEWLEGKPCPFRPCSDYCRFQIPHCLWNIPVETVMESVTNFLRRPSQTEAPPTLPATAAAPFG